VDTVIVTAVQPTCADVISAEMLVYDYTGGAGGAPDCYVTMADLHYILVNWAECNDPQDAACTWPF
jgi:hypothetical protein